MNHRRTLALLALAASLASSFAQQTPAVFPFEPERLLAVLPAAPPEWKTLRSEADTTVGDWLETRATRVFQAPPAAPAAGEVIAPDAKPGEIQISVVDTAGSTPSLAAFSGFAPAKKGNVEKKLIGTNPAIITTQATGQQFVQVLVSTRYLIELKLTNLPRHRVEDWLQGFRFDGLSATSNVPATRPRELRVKHIDELHPKRNRSYAVTTTGAGRLDAFLKTLPPAP